MAAQQQTPMSARLPPDVPSDPKGISDALGVYLRNFALWCRNGFAEQLRNNEALRGVMLRGYDTPAGENPKVWMLEASGAGQLALAPMALGSGDMGAPVPVGLSPYPYGITVGEQVHIRSTDSQYAYVGFYDLSDARHGWVGWQTGSGVGLFNDVGGAQIVVGDDGATHFSGGVFFNNQIHALAGISYGGNWGYGGQAIRLDYDYGGWGLPVLVNDAFVIGNFSCLTVSFNDASHTAVRAWALHGAQGLVYAWYSSSGAWTWANGASDIRLKSNIEPAQKDALAAINALSVVECDLTYPFPPDAKPHHWNWAIVADEELGATIPAAYVAAEEHTHALVRELPVIAALVKAVQQLTARVAELEAR